MPGLDNVCHEINNTGSLRSKSLRSTTSKRSKIPVTAPIDSDDHHAIQKEPAPDTDSHSDRSDDDDSDDDAREDADDGPVFMYGAASNKIGEAAACWLCRWGADMLAYEEAAESLASSSSSSQELATPAKRRVTESCASGPPPLAGVAKEDIPLIWRRGGMDAKWARAVLSSDAFFVRDERERYDLAKKVVELRRKVFVDPAEEREWDELFSTGIHYMHMVSLYIFSST